jgi:hypothetical protein
MRYSDSVRSLVRATTLALLAGCGGDAPITSPADGPSLRPATIVGAVVGSVEANLLSCSPEPHRISQRTIGPQGGTLDLGAHRLAIPAGALKDRVLITGEVVSGTTNSVRLLPEGLTFRRPATLTLDYANCVTIDVLKKVVYTDENLRVLEILKSEDAPGGSRVSAPIDHFSRYAVAW